MRKVLLLVLSLSLMVIFLPVGLFAVSNFPSTFAVVCGINDCSKIMSSVFCGDTFAVNILDLYNNRKVQNNIIKLQKLLNNKYKNIYGYYQLTVNKKEIKKHLLKEHFKIKSLDKYLTEGQKEILSLYSKYLNNKISRERFCKFLYKRMLKLNISEWKYPNSKLYHDLTKIIKKTNEKKFYKQLLMINAFDLEREDRQKVEDILFAESVTAENKDVVFLNLFFEVYRKLLLAEISLTEYEYYKQNYKTFSNIYSKYLDTDLPELSYYSQIAEKSYSFKLKNNKIFSL